MVAMSGASGLSFARIAAANVGNARDAPVANSSAARVGLHGAIQRSNELLVTEELTPQRFWRDQRVDSIFHR